VDDDDVGYAMLKEDIFVEELRCGLGSLLGEGTSYHHLCKVVYCDNNINITVGGESERALVVNGDALPRAPDFRVAEDGVGGGATVVYRADGLTARTATKELSYVCAEFGPPDTLGNEFLHTEQTTVPKAVMGGVEDEGFQDWVSGDDELEDFVEVSVKLASVVVMVTGFVRYQL
jgi:hypothetical protein